MKRLLKKLNRCTLSLFLSAALISSTFIPGVVQAQEEQEFGKIVTTSQMNQPSDLRQDDIENLLKNKNEVLLYSENSAYPVESDSALQTGDESYDEDYFEVQYEDTKKWPTWVPIKDGRLILKPNQRTVVRISKPLDPESGDPIGGKINFRAKFIFDERDTKYERKDEFWFVNGNRPNQLALRGYKETKANLVIEIPNKEPINIEVIIAKDPSLIPPPTPPNTTPNPDLDQPESPQESGINFQYKRNGVWEHIDDTLELEYDDKKVTHSLKASNAKGEEVKYSFIGESVEFDPKDNGEFNFKLNKSGDSTFTVQAGTQKKELIVRVKDSKIPFIHYQTISDPNEWTPKPWLDVPQEGIEMIKGDKPIFIFPYDGNDKIEWNYSLEKNDNVVIFEKKLDYAHITPIGSGEAILKIENGDRISKVRIIVKEIPTTEVKIIKPDFTELSVSQEVQLRATVSPLDTTDELSWSVDNDTIASISQNGILYAKKPGDVVVKAKSGDFEDTLAFKVKELPIKIYFMGKDGKKKYADDNDRITLTVLDEGNFYIEGEDVKATHWDSKEKYWINDKEYAFHFWVDQFNRYFPRKADERVVTVSYTQKGLSFKKDFKLKVVSSDVEEIKVYSNGKELSMQDPIVVEGTTRTYVNVKGRHKGSDEFVSIPETAYYLEYKYNQHIIGSSFSLWKPETFVVTVCMKDDNNVKFDFKAKSKYVPVTGLQGDVPARWAIDTWNKMGEKYTGIRWYDDINDGYTLKVFPAHASNWKLNWKALTPEIAEYDPLHSNGIVPKKPGIAKFLVTSDDNPTVQKEVQVEFYYKTKLKSVSANKQYSLQAGEVKDLVLDIQPKDATEQRFVWTYDKDNIVSVNDIVNINPENVNIPKWTTHSIYAIKPGRVTVTGTPYDQTQGAKPVVFVVEVKSLGEENIVKDLNEVLDWAQNKMSMITEEYTSYEETKDYWKIAEIGKLGKEIKQKDLDYIHKGLFEGATITDDVAILSKSVLALRAAGIDPEQYYGQNLIKKLCKSKVPDNIYSLSPYLWALSSDSYSVLHLDECIDKTIAQILSMQDNATGLWGGEYWSDATGFALYALAPYYGREEVKSAVERAVNGISEKQDASGSIADNSNSLVMVAGGLWSSNPAYLTDSRLVKNGKTMLHALKEYDVASSYEFLWQKNSDFGKPMATEQAYRSLIAYFVGNTFDYRTSSKRGIGDLGVDAEREREKVVLREKLEAVESVLREESLYDNEQIKQLSEEAKNARTLLEDEASTKEELKQKSSLLERLLNSLRKKEIPGGSSDDEGMITVHFTLKGMEKQGSSEQVWIPKTEYKIPKQSKVIYVFDKALKHNGIDYHNSGNYISKIKSPLDNEWLAEFDNGKYSGWMYTVNGEHVKYGLEEYELNDGDDVVWHYTNDYRKEETPSGFGGGGSGGSSQPLQEGSAKVKVELSNGVAKPVLDQKFKNMLALSIEEVKHQEKPTVFVDLMGTKGAREVQMQLDKEVLEALTSRRELGFGIKSDLLILSFDPKSVQILAQVQKNTGKNIEIRAGKIDNITEVLKHLSSQKQAMPLSAKALEQIATKIGNRPVFELKTGAGKTAISDYKDASLKVTLPYKLQTGETKEKMTVYHIGEDGKLTQLQDVVYDAVAGEMTFKTNHLSYYGIGVKQAQEEQAPIQEVPSFPDVVEGQWYAKAVHALAEKQILKGREDGTFRPEENITRAEFITMLANHAGTDTSSKSEEVFSDVDKESWYYAPVMWAKQHSVVSGEGERFRPDSPITREEMAVILNNYAVYHPELELMKANDTVDFADEAKIHSWAKDAVKTMQASGIISGKGSNRFEPAAKANRAEAAQMMYQLLQK